MKTTVAWTIYNEELLKQLWLKKGNNKSITKIAGTTNVFNIDKIMFEWFSQIWVSNLPVIGPMLQQQARQVAEGLGLSFRLHMDGCKGFEIDTH